MHPDDEASADELAQPSMAATRLSVNITESTSATIGAYVDAKGVTITEAVRRLIAYGNVVFEADQQGKKVLIKDDDGEIERLLLVD